MSARARDRRRRSRGSAGRKFLLGFCVLLGFAGLGLGAAAFWVLDIASSAPSIDTLRPADSGTNSEIFDADGNSLGFVQSEILREPVKLRRVPKRLQQATIAIEDANFYDHGGVDYSAIVRAAVENLEAGEVRQGASTITQQLVRNLYIDDPEDTIERKIVEAEMAREYEKEYSKDEILEAYLNTASYGTNDSRTAVGVEAASEVYFNKDVKSLDLHEAALLAGLPQAPTTYNPFLNREGARARRDQVLNAMARNGFVNERRAEQAKGRGLGLNRGYRYEQREEQFFFDFVQQELIDTYGQRKVRRGGLKVYTTLVPEYQEAALGAIAAHPVTSAASALVSTDTQTGEVLAMASSQTYDTSQFNLAAQGTRQPGSAFKPFVLTTAVDQGMDPDATSYPGPSTITLQPYGPAGDPWTVSGGGAGNLRQATAQSVNTVYAQLGIDVGPENFAEMAKKLGVKSPLEGLAAEALGGTSECCTVLEMANAYATIANGGVHHEPTAIRRVEFPDGEEDEPNNNKGKRVISDGVAYEVADVMQGTLDYGTASGHDIGCPAAGKTGTTEEQADAWFVGYTPTIATAVWTGNPNERSPLPGYGADLSAPIWHDYMLVATADSCEDWPEPSDPADLSQHFSEQTASSDSGETTTTTEATAAPAEADGDDDFDDSAYAPGIAEGGTPAGRGRGRDDD